VNHSQSKADPHSFDRDSRKTATIERYHVYGTPRHELRVTYRGEFINWWETSPEGAHVHAYAIVQDDPTKDWDGGPVDVNMCRLYAKRMGFTHVRIVGDWDRRTKPAGGKL